MESEELKKAKLELASKINEYIKLGGAIYTSIEEEFEGYLVENDYDFIKAIPFDKGIYLDYHYPY